MAAESDGEIKATGKSGISRTRTRLGFEAVRQLHDEVVKPLPPNQRGEPGTGVSASWAWTAVPWMSPTRSLVTRSSGVRRRSGARATIRRCGSCRLWRKEPMCCSEPAWGHIGHRIRRCVEGTRKIKTGQKIRVDGNRGVVFILDK